ncbi:MAG: hypothetical protein SOZ80_04475 [Prevotella sp.]|uniref:hypothetical protein n=1 Tax=Prevotella sp. TaxID=59823 RepID=UPI002A3465B3|nr:hypothetical protein [Prevotella sp.]MDD7319148.1 hypothetical protein [Prevotellaceae bacterium]MDY4020016.1 hypothetical protein [Prevotella sp.]
METNVFLTAIVLVAMISFTSVSKVSAQGYGIKLAGVEINEENAADVLADGGKIVYDHASRTLTLNDAVVEYGLPALLEIGNNPDTITLVLNGYNRFNGEGWVVFSDSHLRITGSGSLLIENGTMAIAMAHYKSLTIDGGCSLDLRGRFYGLTTYQGGGELKINASTVRVEGPGYGSILDFKKIILENCYIEEPENAVIATKVYKDEQGNVTETVELIAIGETICKLPILIVPEVTNSVSQITGQAAVVEGHRGFVRVITNENNDASKRCEVFTTSGMSVLNIALSNKLTDIYLKPGMYIVSIDGQNTKVVVE